MSSARIAFVGTSRSGLGHLRRLCNIAAQVQRSDLDAKLFLITNSQPLGLTSGDLRAFTDTVVVERSNMVAALTENEIDLALLDTVQLPDLEKFRGKLFLVLRETPLALLPDFECGAGRPWDMVIVPNPKEHWMPQVEERFAHSINAVGWIARRTGTRLEGDVPAGLVVATGGGGTPSTRAQLYPMLDDLLAETRRLTHRPFVVRQALGPRTAGHALREADEIFDPGGDLNVVFRKADLVVSTAGYNSVLELATTDTPVLLTAIPRNLDDQERRVDLWGARLGFGLNADNREQAIAWLVDQLDRPRRRNQVDPGPDGAARAAQCVVEAFCPAS